MKILITGANGFVGKNLVSELRNQGFTDLFLCTRDTSYEKLKYYTEQAEIVYHLAGVNRPKETLEFQSGNVDFTETLLSMLSQSSNSPSVIFASSIQAKLPNPYGLSKKKAEELIIDYGRENNVQVKVYRFPNLFGKWCKPNYNSVIATFCHNISRDIPIKISDEEIELEIAYIDDVIEKLIVHLHPGNLGEKNDNHFFGDIYPTYKITLGKIFEHLNSFKNSRKNLSIVPVNDLLIKKLYSTYLSYLPENNFSYPLTMHKDHRGSFTEFIRTEESGQVSVNISKPGVTKGNHWHHTKNEKFLVVSGRGVIRFRRIDSDNVIEYYVDGTKLEVVDIPVGYTHNIENLGNTDMVTLMWVNELFDQNRPDTYYMEV